MIKSYLGGTERALAQADQRRRKPFNTGLLGEPCASTQFLPYMGRIMRIMWIMLDHAWIKTTHKIIFFTFFHFWLIFRAFYHQFPYHCDHR